MSTKLAIIITVVAVVSLTLTLVLLAVRQEQVEKTKLTELDKRLGEDVVATFVGGEVTANELRRYINDMTYREGKHAVCAKHGSDHSKCTAEEDCESHPLDSVESYRILLKQLIMEKMVNRWIREKGLASRKEVKHKLKHLVEEINLGALAGQMHADKLKPDKVEMRQYYEQHKEEYTDRPFAEVQEEIEGILIAQKQAEYIPKYIEQLKANAVIERNYDILKVAEPTETEIRTYYEAHRKEYVQPELVSIQTLRISANDEKTGRETAEKALTKLRAGDDFEKVAEEFAGDKTVSTEIVERGQKSKKFEENVFRYYPGELTPIFKDGNFFYIVKILQREGQEQKPLSEVLADVRAAVRRQKEEEKFKLNKYEALFSIHGKRFTMEEFQQEFSELTPEQQKQFASFEAKKNLLDQLIVKELLMEKAEDKGLEAQQKKEIEDLKGLALQEMLHKEEVDEKIEITEQQAREFYEKHKRASQRVEKALAELKALSAEQLAGEGFGQVAKRYSDDPDVVKTDGKIEDWIFESDDLFNEIFYHEFHKNVLSLKKGELSPVFRMGEDFYIVFVRDRQEPRQQAFEEVEELVREDLTELKHYELMANMETDLVRKAGARIYDYTLLRMLKEEAPERR